MAIINTVGGSDVKITVPSGSSTTTKKELVVTASTTDLTAGTSTLATGTIYLVYEA